MSPTAKRNLLRVAKLAIFALTVWYVRRSLVDGWTKLQEQIDAGLWSPAALNWWWLAAAAALYPLGQLPYGWFWRRVLRGLGYRLPLAPVLRAYYVGQLGRYVPGKAMVIVLRGGLLVRFGVKPASAAVSVFYETLTMMAVGSALAAALLAWKFPHEPKWLVATVLAALATGAPTVPAVREFLLKKLRRGRLDGEASPAVKRPGWASLVGCWAVVAIGWLLLGLSIAVIVRAAGFTTTESLLDQWAVGTTAATLSVVFGFLSFIPVGLGVREMVLLKVLGPAYGEAAALVAAVLVRLVWLLSEVAVSVILYLWGPKPERIAPPDSAPDEPPAA